MRLVAPTAGRRCRRSRGVQVDYSFFTPRGHYTLTPALRRFFLAMSVLGQVAFCLPGGPGCPGVAPAPARDAGLARARTRPGGGELWHEIYDPTAFLVGLADDYTPLEVAAAVATAAPGRPRVLATDAAVRRVSAALKARRPVRIDPQRASIRVMGTRFVSRLVPARPARVPERRHEEKPRLLPSAARRRLGVRLAASRRANWRRGARRIRALHGQLAADRQAVAARPAAQWGRTVYDAWLYSLEPVFEPHGTAFPDYMRTDAWAAKDLQAGLGSYTELKHDTILFAKQLVAEGGRRLLQGEAAQLGRARTGRLRPACSRSRRAAARPGADEDC